MLLIPADLRYAARALRRAPVFTLVAVLSLALALAVNTTMFALADAVLHPRLPYPDPHGLFGASMLGGGTRQRSATLDERFRIMRDAAAPIAAITSFTFMPASVQVGARTEDDYAVNAVPRGFFEVLGVGPEAGRVLGDGDDTGQAMVAVVSHVLWTHLFGERRLTPGIHIDVGGATYAIVGIMPRGFHAGMSADLWVPQATAASIGNRRVGPLPLFRLRPGATRQMLRSRLELAAAQLTAAYSSRHLAFAPRIEPLIGRRDVRLDYYSSLVLRIVELVLLIACANLATMMFARGLARRRELALRMALGASRWAIMRLVLAECGLIAAVGATLGAVVTTWSFHLAAHYATPFVPALGDVQPLPSWRVFAFVLVLAAVALLVAGLIPAVWAASTDPAEPIKEGAGTTTGRLRDRYNPLVMVEVALSTGLLMTAALLTISATRLTTFDFRYAAKRLLVADINAKAVTTANGRPLDRFFDDLVDRSEGLSGAATAAWWHPEMPKGGVVTSEEGGSGGQFINLQQYDVVSPGYLRTLGIPVVQGRDFEPGDRAAGSGAVIVDEEAARKLWPNVATPVGHMLKLGDARGNAPWLRVIGVARLTELAPRPDPDLPPPPAIYVTYGGDSGWDRALVLRAADGSDRARADLAIGLRRELHSLGPSFGYAPISLWLSRYNEVLALNSFMTTLFAAFGAFALTLCAVGFYGVLAYSVSRRVREFAVRVALGAPRRTLVAHVVHDAAVMVLAGIGIGAFASLYATRNIGDALYTLRYADVVALVAAEALLLGVAVLGSYGPVRQALSVDPVEMLRAT